MQLLSKVLWVVFFLFCTLCFTVLFEHGTDNFAGNVQTEVMNIQKMFEGDTKDSKKKKE